MKKFGILLSLLLSYYFSDAQLVKDKKYTDKYLFVGGGATKYKVIDFATSPLEFSGWLGSGTVGYFAVGEDRLMNFEAAIAGGELNSTQFPFPDNGTMDVVNFYGAFSNLYRIKKFWKERINWQLGGTVDFVGNIRENPSFLNADDNYEFFGSLAISTRLDYPFTWKTKRKSRQIRAAYQLDIPFLTGISRPPFITLPEFSDGSLDTFETDNFRITSFNEVFRLKSLMQVYYELQNGNMFRLMYEWNYFSYDQGFNKVQTAFHAINVSIFIRLNPKNTSANDS